MRPRNIFPTLLTKSSKIKLQQVLLGQFYNIKLKDLTVRGKCSNKYEELLVAFIVCCLDESTGRRQRRALYAWYKGLDLKFDARIIYITHGYSGYFFLKHYVKL